MLKDGDNLPDEIDDDEYWEPYLEVLHTWYHLCESTVEEATDSWAGMVRHIQIWQAVEETSPDSLSYILEKSWKYKYDAIRLLWNQEVDGYGELMFYNYLSREEMALLENFNPEGRLYEGKFVRNESMNNIGISLGYPSLKEVKEVFNFSWLPSESPDGKWKDLYGFDLYRAESYKPPASAVSNAKKGLELRKEWGRGGLSPSEAKSQGIDSGVTRARKIASGKVSKHDVRRMSAFNRHRKNYRPEKKMPDGGPTAGTIAWLLWGGTSGVNWAKKKSAAMNAESEEFDAEDYNSFTEEMESMIDKYGTLQSYDTSYYDNLMEVSFAFRPHNPYFDDVDFDAEVVESWDAEDGDFVWVLILDSDHFEDVLGGVFTSKDEAIEVFSDYLRSIGGDPDGINWDYDAMVWGHDEEDDPSLGEHSIRLYQEKLNDPDFSKYYAAEGDYVDFDAEELTGDKDIKVGDVVRSYDFCLGGKVTNDDCYVEGIVEKIAPVEWCGPNCDHYHIKTIRRIFNGKPTTYEDYYFPVADTNQSAVRRVARWSAEDWGGDPEGILAKALSRARMRSKEPRKPLKIEKLPHRDQKTLKDFEAVVIPKTSGYAEQAAATQMAIEASEQQQKLLEMQTLLKLKILTPEDVFAMMLGE